MEQKVKSLVSIIVPVYNVEKYIEKCVQSILKQTYKNIEIVLVNDGSKDSSAVICDNLAKEDDRIVVIHKENGGLSDARNRGLNVCNGEYITFVDSDDYLEVDAIEILLLNAIKYDCQITCMKWNIVDCNYKVKYMQSENTKKISKFNSQEYIKGMCEKKLSESVCDKLFRAELFQERRFEKGRLNEDFLLLSRMLFEDRTIVLVDYAGYNYYQRKGSITNSGFGKSLVDSVKNAFELKEMSKGINPNLEVYFARLVLFQARTLFIVIPWSYVSKDHESYTKTLFFARKSMRFLKDVSLSMKDKVFIWAVCHFPKIVLRITSILWKIKTSI